MLDLQVAAVLAFLQLSTACSYGYNYGCPLYEYDAINPCGCCSTITEVETIVMPIPAYETIKEVTVANCVPVYETFYEPAGYNFGYPGMYGRYPGNFYGYPGFNYGFNPYFGFNFGGFC